METALFFGSFNPIHNGHIMIATYILEAGFCDEVWFVVSPKNPLKESSGLLDAGKRYKMVEKAIVVNPGMKACDIEFDMPQPSYTIDTLNELKKVYPEHNFYLTIGEDNLNSFHLWKDYQKIYTCFSVLVYPRPGIQNTIIPYPNMQKIAAPLSDISSTQIREMVKKGEDINGCVPEAIIEDVIEYYEDKLRTSKV